MTNPNVVGLAAVFSDARKAILLPDNDFSWSSWLDQEAALIEIDGILARLQAGMLPDSLQMEVVFAPTGPLQELSLSSGWADSFIRLADRFDLALAGSS